jgi:hypothetical protein
MPTNSLQPSDVYPALTWERLIGLRQIVFDTRKWVAGDAKPDRGDTKCGVGFRAWEQTKFGIAMAAMGEFRSWLSIADKGANFTFKIDLMPIRFCRGDCEEPLPPIYAIPSSAERDQFGLALSSAGRPVVDGSFRLLIQADGSGYPLAVYLALATDGVIVMAWKIPSADELGGSAPIVVPQQPVGLPPLAVMTVSEAAVIEETERVQKEKEAKEKKTQEEEAAKRQAKDKGA